MVRGHQVVVIVPAGQRGPEQVLALPKGHLDQGETPLQAAIREVREETGLEVEPVEELGEIRYSYERKRHTVDKRVVFYLLNYLRGELDHDHEIADVRWMELEDAAHSLTHSGERKMVSRALSRLGPDR